jgi:hypothetical protein
LKRNEFFGAKFDNIVFSGSAHSKWKKSTTTERRAHILGWRWQCNFWSSLQESFHVPVIIRFTIWSNTRLGNFQNETILLSKYNVFTFNHLLFGADVFRLVWDRNEPRPIVDQHTPLVVSCCHLHWTPMISVKSR